MAQAQQTQIVKYLNEHLHDNNPFVCNLIGRYLNSSNCNKNKRKVGSHLYLQPSFPDKQVHKYEVYDNNDFAYNHKTRRVKVTFFDGEEYEFSIFNFKKFLRGHSMYINHYQIVTNG